MLKGRIITIAFIACLLILVSGFIVRQWPVWPIVGLFMLFLLAQTYGSIFINSGFFIRTVCRGNKNENTIALTFDDGPVMGRTERILDILQKKNVKASFFCIGKNISQNGSIVKRIDNEGHLIGNHSYSHGRWFDLQSKKAILTELKNTDEAVVNVIKKSPRFFRPPYGVTNPSLAGAVKEGSYYTIGWSIRSFDTISNNKTKLWNRVTGNLKAGDIVLFHDYCDITIELLPDFIDHAAKVGLKIVRLDELVNLRPYA